MSPISGRLRYLIVRSGAPLLLTEGLEAPVGQGHGKDRLVGRQGNGVGIWLMLMRCRRRRDLSSTSATLPTPTPALPPLPLAAQGRTDTGPGVSQQTWGSACQGGLRPAWSLSRRTAPPPPPPPCPETVNAPVALLSSTSCLQHSPPTRN